MANENTNKSRNNTVSETASPENPKSVENQQSRSVILAQNEIRTTRDYGKLMAALITDVIQEKISPTILFAAVSAGRQMVRVAELNLKYGNPKSQVPEPNNEKSLNLLSGQVEYE